MTQIYFGSAGRQIKSAKNWRPPSDVPAHVPFVGYRTDSEPARRPSPTWLSASGSVLAGAGPFYMNSQNGLSFFIGMNLTTARKLILGREAERLLTKPVR